MDLENIIPNKYPGHPIKRNASGEDTKFVKLIQTALKDFYTNKNIDIPAEINNLPYKEGDKYYGVFGAKTEASVKIFQTYTNITPVDGVVGPNTWNLLFPPPSVDKIISPSDIEFTPLQIKKPTPLEFNKQLILIDRTKKEELKKELLIKPDKQAFDNAIPDNQKPKGKQKLGELVFNVGQTLKEYAVPIAFQLIQEFGISLLEQKLEEKGVPSSALVNQNELKSFMINNVDNSDIKNIQSEFCPTPLVLNDIISQRNNLVQFLNSSGEKLDTLTTLTTFSSGFGDLIQNIVNITSTAESTLNKAMGAVSIPIPGFVPSAINTLGELSSGLTFNPDGTPKIPPYTSVTGQISPSVSMTQKTIVDIVGLLNKLDTLIILCDSSKNLLSISDNINNIASTQLIADLSANKTTYKGFIIQIEEVPYTPTTIRKRAIGKNQSGITLIQTELSFTTNELTLINELKFIIDRDNLEAY